MGRVGEEFDAPVVLKIHGATRLNTGPFRGINLTSLGEGSGWTYAVLSDRESRNRLGNLLAEYSKTSQERPRDGWDHPASWAALLDNIDGIELYGPDDRRDQELESLDLSGLNVVDILLWPSDNESSTKQRIDEVAEVIERARERNSQLLTLAVDERPQTTMIRTVVDEVLLTELLNEAWVERVRPPLRPTVTEADIARAQPMEAAPDPTGEAVGVVDGVVVTANPLLINAVVASKEFPEGHTFAAFDDHGTAVASIASYGSLDFIVRGSPVPQPHPIVSARVLDVRDGQPEVAGIAHLTIPEAIRWMVESYGVRVVNVSINHRYPISSLLRSELTTALDTTARELDVVIVIPTGNRPADDKPARGWCNGYPEYLTEPESRIADPGDAALAITVGSIAERDIAGGRTSTELISIAPAGRPSPFTRSGPVKGPTRTGVMKPELVHVGGNWAAYDNDTMPIVTDPNLAVTVARPPRSGRFVQSQTGTSFAAPAVAREVARIATRYPSASANMLRALIALSARPSAHAVDGSLGSPYLGAYGKPDADRILESAGPNAILTIESAMQTNSVMVHELPIPYDFARGGSRRTVRVALAFDPPVRRSRREYLAGQMFVELVRGLSLADVERRYQRQPSVAEAAANSALERMKLPEGRRRPNLQPRSTQLEWNTLVRRDFIHGTWDPDDESYFLVVTHNQSPWTEAQRRSYTHQRYALAVQVVDEERQDLDVHGQILGLLRARSRVRGRIRT